MNDSTNSANQYPTSAPQMLMEIGAMLVAGSVQVIIAGDAHTEDTRRMVAAAPAATAPGKTVMLIGSGAHRKRLAKYLVHIENIVIPEGKPAARVCSGNTCSEPVTGSDALAALLGVGRENG